MTTELLEKPTKAEKVIQEEPTEALAGKFIVEPLYEIDAVINGWHVFVIGVEKVMEYTIGETNLITVKNEILAKRLLMWIGSIDNDYVGFCTTRLSNFDNKGLIGGVKKYIDVIHLYIKKGTNPMCFFLALNQMKGVAKRINANRIRMWTTKDEWGEALHKRGWKKGYQEYYLEVK